MDAGRAIRICRNARGMSIRQLAGLAGMSGAYLSMLERELRDVRISHLGRIAEALSLTATTLIFIACHHRQTHSWTLKEVEAIDRLFISLSQRGRRGDTVSFAARGR